MSSNGNNNNNNNAAATSSSNNLGRGGAQPAIASSGRGVSRGAGRGRGQPRGGSCNRVRSPPMLESNSNVLTMTKCGQMGHLARNCPRGNNSQQAPPRGGSTAHRGRGGSVEAGQSASSPAPSTPVHDVMDSPVSSFSSVPQSRLLLKGCSTVQVHILPKNLKPKPMKYDMLIDTQPPAKDMASLSLTAQPTGTPTASATSPPVSPRASATSPTVSPRASAPSSPISRPGPGDSDIADDEDIPPIDWEPAKPEDREEQDRLFVEYYKKRGLIYDEEKKIFLPRAYNPWTGYNGETFLRSKRVQEGGFGADTYDEDFVTHTAPASALPELNEKRLKDLAEAREKLAQAQQAPDGPEKAKTVRSLEKEVRLLVNPLEQWVPAYVQDMEDLRRRQVAIPNDIAGNNSRRDTPFKFGHILERMSAVGALGTEEVVGPDLKMVRQNRKWEEGMVWRPKSESKDWADWEDDETLTTTFHGFIPRHPRPHGIGLGHLGYDSVYTRSRDGEWYTAEDVPDQVWEQSVDAPMIFEADDGTRTVVDYKLKEDNPCINKKEAPKPLSQVLAQNKAANAGRAAYQGHSHTRGRGSAPRGGVGRGSGRGQVAQPSPDQGWH